MDILGIIKLVALLAILGAAAYMIESFWQEHVAIPYTDEGKQEQWKIDGPVIDEKDKALKEANASNTAREVELGACRAEASKQTKSIKDAQDSDKAAKAETAAVRQQLAATRGEFQSTVSQLTAVAHTAKTGKETCDSELKEIDDMVRPAARKRMRAITAEPGLASPH